MGPLVAAAPAIGSFLASNASWLAPVAMGLGSMGASQYQGRQQKLATEEAQFRQTMENRRVAAANEAAWNRMAFPRQEAITAASTQNRGAAGQARLGAYQSLASNMARRGMGPGSGLMTQGGAEIEAAYLKNLGSMNTELSKFANTAQFGPSGSTYGQSTQFSPVMSAGGSAVGKAGGLLETGLGFMLMNQMMNPKAKKTGAGFQYDPETYGTV